MSGVTQTSQPLLNSIEMVKRNLPTNLKESGLFCLWKYEQKPNKEKLDKVPYNPFTQNRADPSDSTTFSSFEVALKAINRGYNGLGVGVFDNVAGIDIDHCIGADGKLTPMANDIVNIINAYTEISPSGTGLRILFNVSSELIYDVEKYYIKNSKKGLEIYVSNVTSRFLTVTGNVLIKCGMVDRTKELQLILDKYMARPSSQGEKPRVSFQNIGNSLNDDELMDRARNAKNGDKFARLFNGDWSHYEYDSQSEADFGLCMMLAFWTNRDAERMEHLFRQSGLMRNKWDSKRRGTTYGKITIYNAIDLCTNAFGMPQEGNMLNEDTNKHTSSLLPCLRPVSSYKSKETEFLVDGYIPKYGITLLGGDGGTGKTFIWCSIAAAVSRGMMPELLTHGVSKPLSENTSSKVLYFSGEDSVEYVIRGRLEAANANLDNIQTIDVSSPQFKDLKFNNSQLKDIITEIRPSLVIFDPIQSFIDSKIRMGERNSMRQELMPLSEYAQVCGTAFLIVMHTNKRVGAFGRNRFADSSDIYDFARSALIVGSTSDREIQYMSHEKANYGKYGQTILYSIEDDKVIYRGATSKKDKDFVTNFSEGRVSAQRSEATDFILNYLEANGQSVIGDVKVAATEAGISSNAFENAKRDLVKKKAIRSRQIGGGKGKGVKNYIELS